MAQIGEAIQAKELGYKGRALYVRWACPDCGAERWVKKKDAKRPDFRGRCLACDDKSRRGSGCHWWKGGRTLTKSGYVTVWVSPDDFYHSMADKVNRCAEHRLVMAKHIGRCLLRFEAVHHKNGNKSDNRIENLELTTRGTHAVDHNKGYRDGYQKGLYDGRLKQIEELKEQNNELLKQIKLVQWQLKESKVGVKNDTNKNFKVSSHGLWHVPGWRCP